MHSPIKILFVDQEKSWRDSFAQAMGSEKDIVLETAGGAKDALLCMQDPCPQVVITDVFMVDADGRRLLIKLRESYPDTFVVVVTDHNSMDEAVKAMRSGAYDYIMKPFDFDVIKLLIGRIVEHQKVLQQGAPAAEERRKKFRFENIIGQDQAMLQVFETIHKVSQTDATVLVTGETGTGKELVAEAIHFRSGRREKTYNPVNCAALTETLINSELFGHEKGAFTGAIGQRKGYFELADGGSIFLDEIGDIPIQTQIALLRVLELGTFYRVGGTQPIQVDTRLICATNHDLSLAIREKRFREDLYYRINVVSIRVPPLRERKSDIPLLADYFLKKFADESKKKIDRISNTCMRMLTEYHWPGNVRALANVIERATVFCSGREITPSHIPDELRSPGSRGEITLSLSSRSLPAAEALLIRKVLEETNWNLKQAASALEVARGTLYSKMKKHGIVKAGE